MSPRPTGTALWRQIADTLAREIRENVFPAGERLPTESELAERFQVNRHTLRRAVASLQEVGLVRIEQGRGTFVQEDVIDYPLTKRTRFSEIIRHQARTPSGELIRTATAPADASVAAALGIRLGEPTAVIDTIGKVNGKPISLATHHFPLKRFPTLLEAYESEGSVTAMFRRLGIADYLRRTTRVTSRMPDSYEMRHLRVARYSPLLCVEAINVDPGATRHRDAAGRPGADGGDVKGGSAENR